MATSRVAPAAADLLLAIAANLEAGATLGETLRLVARAGPASAQLARRIDDALRGGSLAAALRGAAIVGADDAAIVALGEEVGRVPAALRWAAGRAQLGAERRRAVRSAVSGPLVLAALGLLADSLPQLVLGAFRWGPALRPLALLALGLAIAWVAVPRLGAALHQLAARSPRVDALLRVGDEARLAALVALFAESKTLGLAPRAARLVVQPARAAALEAIAADPLAPVAALSESLALALQVGLSVGDLPARAAALATTLEATWTARLRATARALAFGVLAIVAVQGVHKLLSSPLPGLGGELGTSPEMRELEKELDQLLK